MESQRGKEGHALVKVKDADGDPRHEGRDRNYEDTSANVMAEAGRTTEGDRQINTALFRKPELPRLWKFEK